MALLDEELVEYWLNNNGFFCMRGVKSGLGEIDFLAIRPSQGGFDAWHVEVQVSFRPIGYIGGNSNAKKRTDDEVIEGVEQWIEKKFTDVKKVARRNDVLPNGEWHYVLVCGELRHETEAELISKRGIKVLQYNEIIAELTEGKSMVNSTAGNIVEIIRYIRNNDLLSND
tara:strand:- start:994 stop:1503 length:510 start_codon:yes stop_codon:yes gene_type:complete